MFSLLLGAEATPKVAVCAPQPTTFQPTPAEVWRVGDDALTSGLRDALEMAFQSSRDFTLTNEKKPETLIVTIPEHVNSKIDSGGRIHVFYKAEFGTVDARVIGRTAGSCWNKKISKCAAQIVEQARLALRKLH